MTRLLPIRRWSDLSVSALDDFDSIFDALMGTHLKNYTRDVSHTIPRANIQELSDRYVVKIAAPGFSKSDFKIHADAGYLTVSAKQEDVPTDEKYSVKEYSYEEFSRSWKIPTTVNTSELTARYEAGILSITLPVHRKKSDGFEVQVE